MKSFSGTSTRPFRYAAALFLSFLLASSAVCMAAEEDKKLTSSFFGFRKTKKPAAAPAAKPAKLTAPDAVSVELTPEEKRIVAEAARKAAERAKAPKNPIQLPPDASFAVQPRKPIWTSVLPAPAKVAGDPNRQYTPYVPQAPTKYNVTETTAETGAPKNPTASPVTPGNTPSVKKR